MLKLFLFANLGALTMALFLVLFYGTVDATKKEKPIIDTEVDAGGGGDAFDVYRLVCADCSPGVSARYACASLVFAKMKNQLKKKDFSAHQIKLAAQLTWKSFHGDLDTKAMVAMARKLKIKHPWLKGKKAK